MKLKEQIKQIMKEHKFLKEQLIGDIVAKIDSVDDERFATVSEQVFGIKMTKDDFKKKVADGELTVEKLQEFDEACNAEPVSEEMGEEEEEPITEGEGEDENTLEEGEGSEEDEEMKTKKESDGAAGEHVDPAAPKENPVPPAQAGAGVKGDKKTDDQIVEKPVGEGEAADGVTGDHKAENADEDADDVKNEGMEDGEEEPKTEEMDEDNEKSKLEQLEDDQNELKEAVEGDLMNLLKDLIGKVHELEQKLMALEQGAEGMEEEEPAEPQPPITQEGLHGAKPLSKRKENANIARSVGKSFFESRSKR